MHHSQSDKDIELEWSEKCKEDELLCFVRGVDILCKSAFDGWISSGVDTWLDTRRGARVLTNSAWWPLLAKPDEMNVHACLIYELIDVRLSFVEGVPKLRRDTVYSVRRTYKGRDDPEFTSTWIQTFPLCSWNTGFFMVGRSCWRSRSGCWHAWVRCLIWTMTPCETKTSIISEVLHNRR
jgi:hypothetical protein